MIRLLAPQHCAAEPTKFRPALRDSLVRPLCHATQMAKANLRTNVMHASSGALVLELPIELE
jgi:hypothetical protein